MQLQLLTTKNIFLVGLMGSGKTTIGRKLATRLSCEFIDTDHALEVRSGVSVGRIFDVEGEAGFRQRETRLLKELASTPGHVVSTGGGIILAAENRQCLEQNGVCIYLQANFGVLWSRLKDCKKRPLLQKSDPQEVIKQLLIERAPLYESVADITVKADQRSVNSTVTKILHLLKQYEQQRS